MKVACPVWEGLQQDRVMRVTYGVLILLHALSQLSREVEAEKPPVPRLSHLRDSGAIEQDADVVMFMYRGDLFEPNTENGVAQLIVAKQRNGPIGTVRMDFSNIFARFEELPDQRRPLRGGTSAAASRGPADGNSAADGGGYQLQRSGRSDPARHL